MRLKQHKARQSKCLAVMLGVLLFSGVLMTQAADRFVVPPGTIADGSGGVYTNWSIAATQIQWAVDAATNAGDTVWVSNGTYCLTSQVTIAKQITVQGVNGWSNTLVYADWPAWTTRCFYVSRTGIVDGLTISNGHFHGSNNYSGGGGALVATGTLQNCYFKNNVCSNNGTYGGGGGVFLAGRCTVSGCVFAANAAGMPSGSSDVGGGGIASVGNNTIIGCYFTENWSSSRGGGYTRRDNTGGGDLISNCVFNANQGGEGVGMYLNYATAVDCVLTNHNNGYSVAYGHAGSTMRNCLIANNRGFRAPLILVWGALATNCVITGNINGGSGVFIAGGASIAAGSILDRCLVSNNLSTNGYGGGGVMVYDGLVRNCLIHHNTNLFASANGGGMAMTNTAGTPGGGIYNCTISENYSANRGGGAAVYGTNNYIVNCIIFGNSALSNSYADIYNANQNSNAYWYSCVNALAEPLPLSQGNITSDPALIGAGNWRLRGNSPCINAGTNQAWMTNYFDLDDKIRIRYGVVDMGAYEGIYEGSIYHLW